MTGSNDTTHALKNCLAIILGYAELLLQESEPDDPRRGDFEEMHRAATTAIRLLSEPREPPA